LQGILVPADSIDSFNNMITDVSKVITGSVRRLHLEIITADIEDICRIINFN